MSVKIHIYLHFDGKCVVLDPSTEKEAKRLFAELSQDGNIYAPHDKSFWNSLYGRFTDKFGVDWIINYSYGDWM